MIDLHAEATKIAVRRRIWGDVDVERALLEFGRIALDAAIAVPTSAGSIRELRESLDEQLPRATPTL